MTLLNEYSELLGLAILGLGVILAFAARALVSRYVERASPTSKPFATAFRGLAPFSFWAVLAGAIALSLNVLGVKEVSGLLDEVLILLPRLLVAIIILGLGHLIGTGLLELVQRRARAGTLASRGAYWVVVAPAIILAAQHLGIEVTFLADLVLLAFSVSLAALGLAYALGSRDYVANLIARRELNNYRVGDRLRVDTIEGTLVEIRRTSVVLSTADGLATIPAARFTNTMVVRLTEASE